MSDRSVGDNYDNALAETVIGLLKTKVSNTSARGNPQASSNGRQ